MHFSNDEPWAKKVLIDIKWRDCITSNRLTTHPPFHTCNWWSLFWKKGIDVKLRNRWGWQKLDRSNSLRIVLHYAFKIGRNFSWAWYFINIMNKLSWSKLYEAVTKIPTGQHQINTEKSLARRLRRGISQNRIGFEFVRRPLCSLLMWCICRTFRLKHKRRGRETSFEQIIFFGGKSMLSWVLIISAFLFLLYVRTYASTT